MPVKNTKNIDDTSTVDEKVETVKDEKASEKAEVYDPDRKVAVKSIAAWTTGFTRIESNGDVTIPANGTIRLTASEVISQVQNNNLLFTGTDSQGSHATLYIEDKPTRIEADFESEDRKQVVINSENVKELFNKTKAAFTKELQKLVCTRAEKYAIIDIIRKEKFNDYDKIRAVEDYTGLRV